MFSGRVGWSITERWYSLGGFVSPEIRLLPSGLVVSRKLDSTHSHLVTSKEFLRRSAYIFLRLGRADLAINRNTRLRIFAKWFKLCTTLSLP